MADRYWVGGTGTWTSTNTANWSATSGGASGASVPTASDNVFFDANSGTLSVTISYSNVPFLSLDATGASGAISAGSNSLYCYGSFILPAGVSFTMLSSGALRMLAPSGSHTLATGGNTLRTVYLGASGGNATISLGDALTQASGISLYFVSGTFNTNGYTLTTSFLEGTSYTSTRTLSLGSSSVYITPTSTTSAWPGNATGMTIDTGTSSITFTHSSNFTWSLYLGNFSYYDVTFSKSQAVTSSLFIFNGASFRNLTATGTFTYNGAIPFYFQNSSRTITGTLSAAGASPTRRLLLSTNGAATTTNAVSLQDVDFLNFNLDGAASPASGTRIGDIGGNTGFSFSSKSVYWNLAGNTSWTSNGWASTSGGTPDVNNFPLAQDTLVFDDAGAMGTVQFDSSSLYIGSIDSTSRTLAGDFYISASAVYITGSIATGSGIAYGSPSPTYSTVLYARRESITVLSAGKRFFPNTLSVSTFSGQSVTLLDAFNNQSLSITYHYGLSINGTFDTGNYSVTTDAISTGSSCVFNAGGSPLTLRTPAYGGSNPFYIYIDARSGGTINATGVWSIQSAGITNLCYMYGPVSGAGITLPTLNFDTTYGTFTSIYIQNNNNKIYDIRQGPSATSRAYLFMDSAATNTYFSNFNLSGYNTSNRTVVSATSGTRFLYKDGPWNIGTGSTVTSCTNVQAQTGQGVNFLAFTGIVGQVRTGEFIPFMGP